MARTASRATLDASARSGGTIVTRVLAERGAWTLADYVCRAGPQDRSVEERHETTSIAAVIEGTFVYKGATGRHVLYPGSILLGTHNTCFECGHDHSTGDRCLAFQFQPEFFAEIAATAGGTSRFKFPTGMLPAGGQITPLLARVQALAADGDGLRIDEAMVGLAETVIAALSGFVAPVQRLTARDERRISAVLRLMEKNLCEAVDLDHLAAAAGMTKYHFIRTFRRVVGMTPYQFLIEARLRQVAVRLAQTAVPVSELAFDAGFGDLSTFNARFRSKFGTTPSRYRVQTRTRSN